MAFIQLCLTIPIAMLVFLTSTLPILCFYVLYSAYKHRKKAVKLDTCVGCVPAIVTQITLDDRTWNDGWIVKAAWIDEQTRQSYTFSSQPQEILPVKHVGDKVLVLINSYNPVCYTMEL